MIDKRFKTIFMLIGETFVIWYGMGTPIPTNLTEGIKLIVALLAVVYTGWKNHDFTPEACIGTAITRQMKAEKRDDYVGDYFFTKTLNEYAAEVEDEEGSEEDE